MTRIDSRRPGDVGKTSPACGPYPTGPGRFLADLTAELRAHAFLLGLACGLLLSLAAFAGGIALHRLFGDLLP